ncbi:testis-expressed protein 22 isoform 1-T3 [Dama dama]|uniref:testis-expressed protein 22 n=1 Tax=Dama dama TaxID=30532 RepID=UPI002A3613A3|nr:testis-expressed protein 22 [Dama dama]XP_061015550.1 testis-expressed protein 22 [Dama dama]XP_061015551.1 testis-expressed protein 22 [Dama dama]
MDSRECSLRAFLRKKAELQPSQEKRQPSGPPSPVMAWGSPGAQSSSQQELQTQDWVCEPQDTWRQSHRRWSVSIDERRRLTMLGRGEKPGLAGAPPSCRDLARIVAQLVSEDVDKDVLFPHPPRSSESTNAFQAFLVRSKPFWHNVTLEAPASRSPPS